jgi:hypothetical protein
MWSADVMSTFRVLGTHGRALAEGEEGLVFTCAMSALIACVHPLKGSLKVYSPRDMGWQNGKKGGRRGCGMIRIGHAPMVVPYGCDTCMC